MKLLVCFKIVPDLDMLPCSDYKIDNHYMVNTSYVKTMYNPYDESALELVLKMRDQVEKVNNHCQLTALTIGDDRSERALKNLRALNYDQTVRVPFEGDFRFNPEAVSEVIYQYNQTIEPSDIIVMGSQSGVGDNGKTPLLLAEKLNIPCITGVIHIAYISDCQIKVITNKDGITMSQVVTGKVVLAVGNVQKAYIRIPTLKAKMATKKDTTQIISWDELGLNIDSLKELNDLELVDLYYLDKSRKSEIIDGNDVSEKVDKLFEEHLKKKVQS